MCWWQYGKIALKRQSCFKKGFVKTIAFAPFFLFAYNIAQNILEVSYRIRINKLPA
jgi:hypothetical protein